MKGKKPKTDGSYYFKLYDTNKDAVNKSQEFTHSLRSTHKKRQEWKAVFLEFLEISIVNAWILCKDYLPLISLKKFKICLIHSWLNKYLHK